MLAEEFMDFAELFAKNCNVVSEYGMRAEEISEGPLRQTVPFL